MYRDHTFEVVVSGLLQQCKLSCEPSSRPSLLSDDMKWKQVSRCDIRLVSDLVYECSIYIMTNLTYLWDGLCPSWLLWLSCDIFG